MDDQNIFSVSDLNRYLKERLEADSLLNDIWIRGEISNFTHHRSGHMYFSLKDEGSRIKAVMFAGANRKLLFMPKEGQKVIVRGNVSVYERDGQYQLYCKEMQADGIGSLYLAFEQLKEKLQTEGLFDPVHKKELPKFPKTIGVITSPTGAAIRDIVTTIKRRYPLANILLYPVLVQGTEAPQSVARAIQLSNERSEVDLLIVGRGGGSIEELWAFNEEIVARSIFLSRIPVISAVGHETDTTIADFVADIRAATPTAAAEIAVPHIRELKDKVLHYRLQLQRTLLNVLGDKRKQLDGLKKSYVFKRPKDRVEQAAQRVDQLNSRMMSALQRNLEKKRTKLVQLNLMLGKQNPRYKVGYTRKQLEYLRKTLSKAIIADLKDKKKQLYYTLAKLDALSPLKVMQRGYSLVYNENHELVKSVQKVSPGDIVKVKMIDGQLDCQVWGIEEEVNYGKANKDG
ncbi:exodeoxyribonuclease VII large subunit [Microaerobacter geothermalis]|uniref:exodeoxyribonuclease VII large subunit n=1 Tax=Microaerobacter geothermalis TaxID=674972 RepID=UPI001F236F56|nr:exodeoxyribonuclease VII large subunit [Microaerobacter geothermalis]MCF6094441.1 exodeoxyribonuclease VII large subunit [Microaerobacter geothermalis]